MARLERAITIDAPVGEVFELVQDLGRLWVLMPDVGIRDLVQTPEGVGSHGEWYTKLVGPLYLEGQIEVTELVPGERMVATSSTGPVFTLTLAPHDGGTLLTVVVAWSFDNPVLGTPLNSITTLMAQGDITTWLVNIKAAVEGVSPELVRQPAEHRSSRLTRSVTIAAATDVVFDDVLNLGTFWAAAPDVAVRAVNLTPEGLGSSLRIFTHVLGIHMEGDLEIVEVRRPHLVRMKVTFGPESPMWSFLLEPANGGTRLTGEGEWHMGLPVVGRRIEHWTATAHTEFLETILSAAKERAEAAAVVRS